MQVSHMDELDSHAVIGGAKAQREAAADITSAPGSRAEPVKVKTQSTALLISRLISGETKAQRDARIKREKRAAAKNLGGQA